MSSGKLSIVATPIGNLEDITLRALRTLREASTVLAEDTRRTRGLLTHHGISTPLRALHAHSSERAVDACLQELLAGAHLALVTDAGTPLVSDPGAPLVRAAAEAGVLVESIPGPSAVIAALTVAAIPCDGFRFFGFIPRTGKGRREALTAIARNDVTSVLFESPQRIQRTLTDLAELAGAERGAAVCRELTKLHEEVARGSLGTLITRFAEGARGEITLVVAPAPAASDESKTDPAARAHELMRSGLSVRDAARQLADETGIPKRDAYALVQAHAAARDAEHEDEDEADGADDGV